MLRSLTIKNLALFKSQEIEFDRGLNIILGETGAGKSLIFDALFFVLSIKTDKLLLRTGEESMRVDAVFEPISENVRQILKENDLDDEELVLSRVLHADGRTSSKVNGSPCAQSVIKKLASELVDSFMQHESMEILKSKNHLQYLDRFCDFGSLKEQLAELLSQLKDAQNRINSLGGDEAERERKRDFLSYQIKEIENANLKIGEDEQLQEKIKMLESAERIGENLSEVLRLLEGAGGALGNMSASERLLGKLSDLSDFENLIERMESARIEVDDIASEVKGKLFEAQSDPIELERLNDRKDKIKFLKRKYGDSIEKVLQAKEEFITQLDALIDAEDLLQKLQKKKQELQTQIDDVCKKITQIRELGAVKVKKGLESELNDLGMKGVRFEVKFDKKPVSQDGCDDVSFIFSANKGQQLKDLSKTASGGESSRIMLAMKNIFASKSDERTLLFDEIDSGISGEVGNMMAAKLASISRRDQVIAITHLPQVASAGDEFVKVQKYTDENTTYSSASKVKGEKIIEEIAHIIGGNNVTEVMLENAKQLFERGRQKQE